MKTIYIKVDLSVTLKQIVHLLRFTYYDTINTMIFIMNRLSDRTGILESESPLSEVVTTAEGSVVVIFGFQKEQPQRQKVSSPGPAS